MVAAPSRMGGGGVQEYLVFQRVESKAETRKQGDEQGEGGEGFPCMVLQKFWGGSWEERRVVGEREGNYPAMIIPTSAPTTAAMVAKSCPANRPNDMMVRAVVTAQSQYRM